MAYDITPKTQPANMDYENSKAFSKIAQYAHEDKMQQDRIKAAQPSKYMQTLQAINSTLQTVNNGLQVAENVNKIYDQITERSFKQEQLEKQNRLKEQIQGAINEHDWDTVATLAMTNLQTASQMPEYMDSLGRMAKIEGNEGSAAILRSINTEQQGKLEIEDIRGGYSLQRENIKGQFSLQKQAMADQAAMQRTIYSEANTNARFNSDQQFKASTEALKEEGRNLRNKERVEGGGKNKKGSLPSGVSSLGDLKNLKQNLNESGAISPTPTPTPSTVTDTSANAPTNTTSAPAAQGNYDYINKYKQNSFIVPLTTNDQNNQIANKLQQFDDASNIPSKQEQEKAQGNKEQNLQNQQNISEFINSYNNKEVSFKLNNLGVEGATTGDKLVTMLKNPTKYNVNVVTEPYKINNLINGEDNLKNPLNANLADKYKDVVAIAQLTNRITGRSEQLYLTSPQANLFADIQDYSGQYVEEFNKAMGNSNIGMGVGVYDPLSEVSPYMIPYRYPYPNMNTSAATPTPTPTPTPTQAAQQQALVKNDYTEYKKELTNELTNVPKDIKESPQAVGALVESKVQELSQNPDALNSLLNGPMTQVEASLPPTEQEGLRAYIPKMSIPMKQELARIILTAIANKESKRTLAKKLYNKLQKSTVFLNELDTADKVHQQEYFKNKTLNDLRSLPGI